MARRRRVLSVQQAAHALRILLDQGRVKTQDVLNALENRERLIRDLQQRLKELGAEGIEAGNTLRKRAVTRFRAAEKASRPARKRAKANLSAATRKLYQAQGRYMSALRPLSKAARTKIKAIRAKSGIDAAITAAKRLGG